MLIENEEKSSPSPAGLLRRNEFRVILPCESSVRKYRKSEIESKRDVVKSISEDKDVRSNSAGISTV